MAPKPLLDAGSENPLDASIARARNEGQGPGTGPTYEELTVIQQAVREAFEEDANGTLVLTVSGVEIRPMADGSRSWAVFANGIDGAREVYRRRICFADGFSTSDVRP